MVEWFQERYVSREEHQNVVAYYKKLVVQLHGTVLELRSQLDDQTKVPMADHTVADDQDEISAENTYTYNVVRVDFRKQR